MGESSRGIIVNPETKEEIGHINQGDRIIRQETLAYLNSTKEWKIEHFFKGHVGEINKWLEELSVHEKAFLFSIVPYIGYEDCHLQYGNGIDIGTEDLVKVTGMPRRTVYATVKSLIKKDIIYRGRNSKNRQYFVNPWLFCKGNRINRVLKTMFKNYRIKVLGGMKWKDLKD